MLKKNDLFRKLRERRKHLSSQLKNPAAAGFWNMVVDKYSDQAHFIYELIQNADDAGATKAAFILQQNGLIFIHNGIIPFSITDPEDETDRENIGHLNAITSIGASSKQQGNTIGKFGIGFKSVFQYTDTPHIEDDYFSFRIVDFIVPEENPYLFPERKQGETLFYIPFKDPEEAFPDILEKLSFLHKPLLFLQSLQQIEWKSDSGLSGCYRKSVLQMETWDLKELVLPENWLPAGGNPVSYSFVLHEKREGEERYPEYVHLFSQPLEILYEKEIKPVVGSVGFYASSDGSLQLNGLSEPAFCFFPTKERTDLNMLIHAPFLLTDSRESIKFSEEWNKQLIDRLAMLAANSIECLCKPFFHGNDRLIDDNLFAIIPVDKEIFYRKEKHTVRDVHPFSSFYERFCQKLSVAPVFLSNSGRYLPAYNTRYASEKSISRLFTSRQLAFLFGNEKEPEEEWSFTTLYAGNDSEKNEFVRKSLIYIRENGYIHSLITPELIGEYVSGDFIEKQSTEWLRQFYIFLSGQKKLWSGPGAVLRYKPFILCKDGTVRAPYEEEKDMVPKIYLSGGKEDGFPAVHPDLLTDEKCLRFFEWLGLNHPGLLAEIERVILPKYKEGQVPVSDKQQLYQHLNCFVEAYSQLSFQDEKKKAYLQLFRGIPFLPAFGHNGLLSLQASEATYFDTPILKSYLRNYPDAYFLDNRVIEEGFYPENRDNLYQFLIATGVSSGLRIKEKKVLPQKKELLRLDLSPKSLRRYDKGAQQITDKEVEGFNDFLKDLTPADSKAFADLLIKSIQEHGSFMFRLFLEGDYRYIEKSKQLYTHEKIRKTTAWQSLFKEKWLYDNTGSLKNPDEIGTTDNLSSVYERKFPDLFFFLGIFHDPSLDNLNAEQRRAVLLIQDFKKKGISIEELEALAGDPALIDFIKNRSKEK
jgi:hypothetical protein